MLVEQINEELEELLLVIPRKSIIRPSKFLAHFVPNEEDTAIGYGLITQKLDELVDRGMVIKSCGEYFKV